MANAPEKAAQYAYIVYHLFPCIYIGYKSILTNRCTLYFVCLSAGLLHLKHVPEFIITMFSAVPLKHCQFSPKCPQYTLYGYHGEARYGVSVVARVGGDPPLLQSAIDILWRLRFSRLRQAPSRKAWYRREDQSKVELLPPMCTITFIYDIL